MSMQPEKERKGWLHLSTIHWSHDHEVAQRKVQRGKCARATRHNEEPMALVREKSSGMRCIAYRHQSGGQQFRRPLAAEATFKSDVANKHYYTTTGSTCVIHTRMEQIQKPDRAIIQ